MAISESFTVTWAAKKFTTQPQGDMVIVGDTVSVTANKNFYVEKYEIEYNDNGVWKLYQEISGGWDAFNFDFTSDVAKSVSFRIKAYAEGDEYDEVNECWPVVLMDTSEEFTITWMSNEHVHTYGAIPNGKDETSHWKECTDPACPDKAHSKIEVEVHKDNTADNKCDICGADVLVPPPAHTHDHGTIWKADANEHWNECACGDKANVAPHADTDNNGKCDTCEYQMSTTPNTPDNPNNTPDNPNNTPDDPSDDKDGLGAGAIIGIVVGSVAVVGIGGFAIFWFVIKKKSFADFIAVFKK